VSHSNEQRQPRGVGEIESLLERLEAAEQARKESNHSGVTYCLACDEFEIEHIDYQIDELILIDCSHDHYDHHLKDDYEITTLTGFKWALRWV